jgi:hypothetical protein
MDIWIRLEMSDGEVIDLQYPSDRQKIIDQIEDPQHIEQHGRIKIVKQSVMSDIAIGCR